MGLTADEKKHFFDHGYLIKEGVFPQDDMQPIKDAITGLIHEKALELQAEGELDELYESSSFETRLNHIYQHDKEVGQKVIRHLQGRGGGGFAGPEMLASIRHDDLIDCIEDLVGPDIVGSSVYRIRPKISNFNGGDVPWHQDSGYILPHCDKQLIVTCWIPLVDVTKEHGCLYVIPDAHQGGVVTHCTGGNAGFLVIPDDALPEGDWIPCEMPAGSVLFLTNITPHCSFANTSDVVRWSLDLRYQSKDVPNNVGEKPSDYVIGRELVTMACYPPEADFIIRDSTHPENEVTTPEEFAKIRGEFENGTVQLEKFRTWNPVSEHEATKA
jgi:hypothetical protein